MHYASLRPLSLVAWLLAATACAHSTPSSANPSPDDSRSTTAPSPDRRLGLRPGVKDAQQAAWNLRLVSHTPTPPGFVGVTNSDLAFTGNYVIQGNYNGYQVWDLSDPVKPSLKTAYVCPASQSDVSVYRNLLFVSGEDLSARLDCGAEGVPDTVSSDRLRGLRIFDISDIAHPRNVGNVQTCRGSHTHSLLVDSRDMAKVYVYISGSSRVRSDRELPGCQRGAETDPNSALFRIEVIKVPVAHPEQAAIVSSPRIFHDLAKPLAHGETPEDSAATRKAIAEERARGGFVATIWGEEQIVPPEDTKPLLDSIVKARNGSGAPNAADSAALRGSIQRLMTVNEEPEPPDAGPTQCHDITLYPAIGLAGGACGGYGLLIDISDPAHPTRIGAVADSNFSYWHSATFNNDGTKLLFSDEWGGGSQAKCRKTDKYEWGADAIFTLANREMQFQSYYKMPAPQTSEENCVAHNGSLIPIPGRDVMIQSWYQGGVSVFDWTDAAHPKEIAYFDRGPMDDTRLTFGGSWSVYWYNGVMVSSETMRGLDILELTPSGLVSQNEIDAAKSVRLDYLNTQGQPKLVWPPSFALARAYLDQLERSKGLAPERIAGARQTLASAEKTEEGARHESLTRLSTELAGEANGAGDGAKVRTLAAAVKDLAEAAPAGAGAGQ